jgi:hypothetical protein
MDLTIIFADDAEKVTVLRWLGRTGLWTVTPLVCLTKWQTLKTGSDNLKFLSSFWKSDPDSDSPIANEWTRHGTAPSCHRDSEIGGRGPGHARVIRTSSSSWCMQSPWWSSWLRLPACSLAGW